MKNLKTIFTVMFALVATFVFQSCLNDNDSDVPDYAAIATTHVTSEADAAVTTYYFQLDNEKTLIPISSSVGNFKAVEGQRVIIQYDIEETATAGYDYSIELFNIAEVLTKDIKLLTAENEKEMGHDAITVIKENSKMAGGYLNLSISFVRGSSTATVNLVENTINPAEDSDYTVLELRLNNPNSDASNYSSHGLVSFKMADYNPTITGKKGIKVIAKGSNVGEVREYTFTYDSTEE